MIGHSLVVVSQLDMYRLALQDWWKMTNHRESAFVPQWSTYWRELRSRGKHPHFTVYESIDFNNKLDHFDFWHTIFSIYGILVYVTVQYK